MVDSVESHTKVEINNSNCCRLVHQAIHLFTEGYQLD